jgi:hypothetical protein
VLAGIPDLTRERLAVWGPFALLVLGSVLPLWWVGWLPGQDLAAHLAYARVLRDLGDPTQGFAGHYQVTPGSHPYLTTYHLLIALSRVSSLVGAARALCTLYVLGLFASIFFLARQAHPHEPRDRPPVAVYLLAPLVWNPTAAMGFLVFQLTLPLMVAGAGMALWSRTRPRLASGLLAGLCVLAGSLHVFSSVCLTLVVFVLALVTRQRRHALGAAVAAGATAATMALWSAAGELGVRGESIAWSEGLRAAVGFEAITHAFRVAWGTPPLKLTYACYTLFGPYGAAGLVTALAAAALMVIQRRRPGETSPHQRGLLVMAAALAAVSALAPWGIYLPSEFTFIDLRLMTLAGLVLVAVMPPAAFLAGRGRQALIAFALLCCLIVQWQFAAFARQTRPVRRLLDQIDRREALVFLSFDGTTPGWGRLFRLSQTLPLYHTVLAGGFTPQLWGRYTRHLPIEFAPGREPAAPPVWQPWELEAKHLADAQAVLVQAPRPGGPDRTAAGFHRAAGILETDFRQVACDGPWCLYRRR